MFSRVKPKPLTRHAAAYVPSAGPLPKRQFLPCQIERHASGARLPAARRHPRPDQHGLLGSCLEIICLAATTGERTSLVTLSHIAACSRKAIHFGHAYVDFLWNMHTRERYRRIRHWGWNLGVNGGLLQSHRGKDSCYDRWLRLVVRGHGAARRR